MKYMRLDTSTSGSFLDSDLDDDPDPHTCFVLLSTIIVIDVIYC